MRPPASRLAWNEWASPEATDHRPHNISASYTCQSTRMIYPSTFFQKRKRNGHPPWDEWACPEATTQRPITVTSRNLETVIVIISGDYILSWSSSGLQIVPVRTSNGVSYVERESLNVWELVSFIFLLFPLVLSIHLGLTLYPLIT